MWRHVHMCSLYPVMQKYAITIAEVDIWWSMQISLSVAHEKYYTILLCKWYHNTYIHGFKLGDIIILEVATQFSFWLQFSKQKKKGDNDKKISPIVDKIAWKPVSLHKMFL